MFTSLRSPAKQRCLRSALGERELWIQRLASFNTRTHNWQEEARGRGFVLVGANVAICLNKLSKFTLSHTHLHAFACTYIKQDAHASKLNQQQPRQQLQQSLLPIAVAASDTIGSVQGNKKFVLTQVCVDKMSSVCLLVCFHRFHRITQFALICPEQNPLRRQPKLKIVHSFIHRSGKCVQIVLLH